MGDDAGLAAELRANGIGVERVERGDPVEVTYMTAFPGESVDHGEMGRVLTVFIDLAREGAWTPTRVEATVVRHEDDVQGTWHADPEWFEALLADEMSETAFSTRVLGTLSAE